MQMAKSWRSKGDIALAVALALLLLFFCSVPFCFVEGATWTRPLEERAALGYVFFFGGGGPSWCFVVKATGPTMFVQQIWVRGFRLWRQKLHGFRKRLHHMCAKTFRLGEVTVCERNVLLWSGCCTCQAHFYRKSEPVSWKRDTDLSVSCHCALTEFHSGAGLRLIPTDWTVRTLLWNRLWRETFTRSRVAFLEDTPSKWKPQHKQALSSREYLTNFAEIKNPRHSITVAEQGAWKGKLEQPGTWLLLWLSDKLVLFATGLYTYK